MMLRNLHFWRVWLPPHVLALIVLIWSHGPATWITAFVCYCLISGLGVAVGLHRYFSHRSFATSRAWEHVMLYCGILACHGNPLFWVALHRGLHHRHADGEKDPHSPAHGLWHAYQGYAFSIDATSVPMRAGADFLRNPGWMWSVKYYHRVLWGTWCAVALASVVVGPWLLVGLALAQVWAIHQEAIVNVLGHTSGFGAYRTYDTDDRSVNRNWLGLLTWGQALHQNHHHSAGGPDFAHGPREFDPSMIWIKAIRNRT